MFNRPTLSAPGPVRITPSELVTATALRVARAGYDAARVPAEEEAQQHRESAVYHSRNGFTMGLELAHALLGQHSHGLRGGARW